MACKGSGVQIPSAPPPGSPTSPARPSRSCLSRPSWVSSAVHAAPCRLVASPVWPVGLMTRQAKTQKLSGFSRYEKQLNLFRKDVSP
jgi:hypothetical protein